MKIKENDESKSPTPTVNKAVKSIKKLDAKKKEIQKSKHPRGIIMLSHIPHGFYEKQMAGFFSQFGKVLRVKVARSRKTGKSKGYGYVEFEFEEVARIAAETMDNYLMFERLVKCKLLEPDVNAKLIFADRYIRPKNCPARKNRKKLKEQQEVPKTEEEKKVSKNSRLMKLKKQNDKLTKLGIDYEFSPSGVNLNDISPIKTPKEKKQTENDGDKTTSSSKKKRNSKKSPLNTPTTTPTTTTTPIRKRKISASNADELNITATTTTANSSTSITEDIIEKVPTPKKIKKSLTPVATASPAIKLDLNSTPSKKRHATKMDSGSVRTKTPDKLKQYPFVSLSPLSPKKIKLEKISTKQIKKDKEKGKELKGQSAQIEIVPLDLELKSKKNKGARLALKDDESSSKSKKKLRGEEISEKPKFSPKLLRRGKQVEATKADVEEIVVADKKQKKKKMTEESTSAVVSPKPKFSPKMLRSRGNKDSIVEVAPVKSEKGSKNKKKSEDNNELKNTTTTTTTPVNKNKSSLSTESKTNAIKTKQSGETKLPKFSPKLLRSRNKKN